MGSPAIFWSSLVIKVKFALKHSFKEEAQWQGEGWRDDFEGLCAGKGASPPAPVEAPLLPSFSLSFFLVGLHPSFNRFFLSILTPLPDFCSNRCNTNKLHLGCRKRPKKHKSILK